MKQSTSVACLAVLLGSGFLLLPLAITSHLQKTEDNARRAGILRTLRNGAIVSAGIACFNGLKGRNPTVSELKDLVATAYEGFPSEYITRQGDNSISNSFDASGGWYYNPDTGNLRINRRGTIELGGDQVELDHLNLAETYQSLENSLSGKLSKSEMEELSAFFIEFEYHFNDQLASELTSSGGARDLQERK